MGTQPIIITDEDGNQLKVGRAGLTNKSPITPQDRMLVWQMLTAETGPAETGEIVQAVWRARQDRGDPFVQERLIKVAITWARRQIRRDLDNQKLNTTEGKRLKKVINSLIEEFETVGNACTTELKENPKVFKEEWFQKIWDRRLRLSEMILKYMDRTKDRVAKIDFEALRKLRDNPPRISDVDKYADRIPFEEIIHEGIPQP